ncbi:MAG: DsbA family protein, partial [Pseudomonadota bacterium]|nr:DsbA family protein [Pseudomonadota bacterium]
MKKKLEFFFDYVSPYSYLANSQILKLKEVEVLYRPILLGAVMQATKNSPPGNIPEKGIYLISDVQRWAKHYGIPYR